MHPLMGAMHPRHLRLGQSIREGRSALPAPALSPGRPSPGPGRPPRRRHWPRCGLKQACGADWPGHCRGGSAAAEAW